MYDIEVGIQGTEIPLISLLMEDTQPLPNSQTGNESNVTPDEVRFMVTIVSPVSDRRAVAVDTGNALAEWESVDGLEDHQQVTVGVLGYRCGKHLGAHKETERLLVGKGNEGAIFSIPSGRNG